MWQECQQRPRLIDGEPTHAIEDVVAHYQTSTGSVYYAIKWAGYECPTWELESDLDGCVELSTPSCMRLAPVLEA
ncbi:hypothetical protein PG994_015151 [Apiospora phragmitis]|uniref:Chromo domain-containing protein n=1 Tax=Apiospora phragmitis TaxID=2905665 RepID=A0ABR1SVP0_9PEZI